MGKDDGLALTVIQACEPYIRSLSKKTFVRNLGMDSDDLRQEGRIKVLEVVRSYEGMPVGELIAFCISSLANFYKALIRKSYREKYSGIVLDLDDAFSLSDGVSYENMFVDLQLSHAMELFDGDEKKILDCLLWPDEGLVKLAEKHFLKNGSDEVRITREVIADHLGVSKSKVNRLVKKIRTVFATEFEQLEPALA